MAKDLFNEPYHQELDKILTDKGFFRKRMNKRIILSYDTYTLDKVTVVYHEDDSLEVLDENGQEVSEELFNEITNYIFADSKH